jgi:predicted HTH transcriptional regulator
MTPEELHTNAFKEFRELGRVCADYLSFFPEEWLAKLIAGGENTTLEFKSTLRWDLHQKKRNDAVTHAVLKSIAAFLNTDGGRLLIGVGDDRKAVGIELDGFPDDDGFVRHLFSMIKSSMGLEASTLVAADVEFFDGKKVCSVRCRKSTRPVYLKTGGKGEEFFIRTGPSTERLGPSDLVTYVNQHFKA